MICYKFDLLSHFRINLGHSWHEFLESDASVSVFVGIFDDLVNFCSWKMFTNTCSNSLEFNCTENSLSFLVEFIVNLLESGLAVGVSTKPKDLKESWEINISTMTWTINNSHNLPGLIFDSKCPDCVD